MGWLLLLLKSFGGSATVVLTQAGHESRVPAKAAMSTVCAMSANSRVPTKSSQSTVAAE